jgi:NAD(P)H dehydrogenase (quinone)
MQLYPINYGIFRFCGFDVLPPHISFAAARVSPEQRAAYLDSYAQRLRTLATTPPIVYPSLEEFDETFRRRVAG